jgi:RNA polymerase sigma factor (sigma-70 family)
MAGYITAQAIREGSSASSEGIPDEELLARFLDEDGTASQDAFRVLVGRHGPRVLRICQHILDREHDAEDAFQATFLALARSGATIRDRCALGGWLQEVAYRTSLKTRMRRSRRRLLEKEVVAMTPTPEGPGNPYERAALDEIKPVLHEEVTGLPDKYRIPVVLSYLEGKTNEEVAALLHWPVGTVKGRLSRGRALLRSRLMRRGVALSLATLMMHLSRSQAEAAEVPDELLQKTLELGIETGSSPIVGDLLGSFGQGTAEVPPVRQAAKLFRTNGPKTPRRVGRLVAAPLLLVAFSAALFVGGYVSAAAFGGKFVNFRSALSGLVPSFRGAHTPAAGGSCHTVGIR